MPTLKFNRHIYKNKAIQQAIVVYSHLARFNVKNNKEYIEIKLDNIDSEVKDILADEFANYVLSLTKKCL